MNHPAARLDARLAPRLAERRQAGLYRCAEALEDYDGATAVRSDGQRCTVFCGNDYLGLAADPRPARALAEHARRQGSGAGAAHLVTGHRPEHEALEAELAAFTGREAALLFSTGYMANLGVVTTLVRRGQAVAEDRLNHASLIDAVRLAGGRPRRYRHADPTHLAQRLDDRAQLVVTDGVFSMDGDVAPLPELAAAAEATGAALVVDDAHGLGVIGPEGGGSVPATGCAPERVPVLVGTLGKAFGTFGAFVAGSRTLIDALRQWARPYIYTTAPPPAQAAAALEAVRIARAEGWRREHLQALIARFRSGARQLGLPVPQPAGPRTPIQPVLVGPSATATAWSAELDRRGLRVAAIRPPTVPAGTARLRVSLTACHSEEDVDRLLEALAAAARQAPPTLEAPS
ncbi:8-amino-7-oxononanoate synthase [Halorhodospira halophila]|uniref:8-amino-7-oxononanoate synthase n=1 Tax=Halorhodospira halophila (strain DSM 244 / SL1) TaxID=349124 RepID=BIOF_HALHL|nr:8-amino-7-oxononanoate synthase [Halorhodospira halophila]A1WVM6.1 RecName: Full=8-amino-7-oxononanoate synthase; Short=AONS; AltName: Full=7-keto-8-amino-pelargonic acid synthase; Short=7-KAP synthase; Short=KAPA synthase; AltName: Full=8-amino-7-ketopelargonate synthase [Halorhodospira halophila SL1]ABM61738.1 8-amino-7-oxononanoate synthase [Halorhodospira halophila SL1]MBK1728933.1 8-amino-7-oxononanoate synthase [Halorhodospira halophila]